MAIGNNPDVLERIVATKREEVAVLRGRAEELRRACADTFPARDLAGALRGRTTVGLIAEIKRRSPGAGSIRPDLVPASLACSYEQAGAVALSVLTDGPWFGGNLSDFEAARTAVGVPVLRKDFTLVEEQVLEARVAGADAVLLIVRILDDVELRHLREVAESVGMTALVEVHGPVELQRALRSGARVVGINNRDLTTFTTTLDTSFELLSDIPADVLVVSESGIRSASQVDRLGRQGVHAVLVGEALLRQSDPAAGARALAGRSRRERVLV